MAFGGELHGTAEYFQQVGSVSDIQMRGVLYHPDLNRFVTLDSIALFQPSGADLVLTLLREPHPI